MAQDKIDIAKQQALEQENKILKQRLADAEKLIPVLGDSLATEIKKIRQKGKASANSIVVTEHHDHKNISLWTKWGKRVGPMHPENAIQALNRFADIGVVLSADQPDAAQIEAYKQTAEWKARVAKESKHRAEKDKSKRSGQMDRLSAEIAKMSGTTVDAINHILKASEVGRK